MTRSVSIFPGLVGLVARKLSGDALSQWLGVSVPGGFWGFLKRLLVLAAAAVLGIDAAMFADPI